MHVSHAVTQCAFYAYYRLHTHTPTHIHTHTYTHVYVSHSVIIKSHDRNNLLRCGDVVAGSMFPRSHRIRSLQSPIIQLQSHHRTSSRTVLHKTTQRARRSRDQVTRQRRTPRSHNSVLRTTRYGSTLIRSIDPSSSARKSEPP